MIHVVNGSGLSLEQSAIHNASLQVCVLRGILGLDQSNTDLLANICLLGTLAGGEHTQSLLDCISGIGVAVDVLLTDDLAGDLLNSIVRVILLAESAAMIVSIASGCSQQSYPCPCPARP